MFYINIIMHIFRKNISHAGLNNLNPQASLFISFLRCVFVIGSGTSILWKMKSLLQVPLEMQV